MKLIEVRNVYRAMKNKPHVGQLRARSWRVLIEPSGLHDAVWSERCRE